MSETADLLISLLDIDPAITINLTDENPQINIELSDDSGDLPPEYKGETEVVPKAFEDQTLKTKNTLVTKDIVVSQIPYFAVSNPAGGYTVSIAS